jgi:ABC-type uncharacterized transport system fused permease/ATPase subunit
VAAPYWSSEDKVQARLRLAAVFALTLGTTGISVGFNFLGRDFYNALASKLSLFLFLYFFRHLSVRIVCTDHYCFVVFFFLLICKTRTKNNS